MCVRTRACTALLADCCRPICCRCRTKLFEGIKLSLNLKFGPAGTCVTRCGIAAAVHLRIMPEALPGPKASVLLVANRKHDCTAVIHTWFPGSKDSSLRVHLPLSGCSGQFLCSRIRESRMGFSDGVIFQLLRTMSGALCTTCSRRRPSQAHADPSNIQYQMPRASRVGVSSHYWWCHPARRKTS